MVIHYAWDFFPIILQGLRGIILVQTVKHERADGL